MPEIIKKYEHVTDFDVKSGNVLTHYINGELQVDGRVVATGLPSMSYELCTDRVFYSPDSATTLMYEIDSQQLRKFAHTYQIGSYQEGVAVFREGENFEEATVADGQVRPLALQFGAGGSAYAPAYIVHTSLEGHKRERILCYDRTAQRYTWEYDVKDVRYPDDIKASKEYSGEVKSILGFYKDVVIVALKGEKLLAIDLKTGALRWRIDFVEGATPEFMRSPRLPSASGFRIEIQTGNLVSFHQNIYIALDIETGKNVSVINDFNAFVNNGLSMMHSDWFQEGDMIYYYTSGLKRVAPQIIAYNLGRKAIEWTQVFEEPSTNADFPKYHVKKLRYADGLFFVLDSNNVLTVLKN